ncbi:hypothetical protein EDC39_10535 [Geothermobacter ehrlichii]|uniref:Tetratricopeptide repeat protein n=1 Tax=Geothermobacter ehrlichii TaxID=213224 RepID=A0A5D3WL30_9BACT|nr:hypothetical protein [Geothermobacter ehrlichii]TYO98673.1 hypothetical protein EDC39_10535 [Geothermobacter ehrlichii]
MRRAAGTGRTVLFALLGLLLLTGCAGVAGVAVTPDPELGRRLFREAEQLYATRNYRQAADRLAQAAVYLPANADLILRRGEVEEYLGNFANAARIYRQGLQQTGERLNEIRYHLARLELRVLKHPQKARELFRQIPNWDWHYDDLRALFLLLEKKDPRGALQNLNWIPYRLKNAPESAFVHFHIALAYAELGQIDKATERLLLAIDRNSHKGLSRQIERFWNRIQNAPLPPAR